MAKYYYGYFRSLDTSNDPKGQLYKTIIFTGYDNEDDPYPMKWSYVPSAAAARRYVPDQERMIKLQMGAHPFIVDYNGFEAKDTKYKPYFCSTASITFMLEEYNTDFIDASGCKNLALLLRWKPEVEPVYYNGQISSYINTLTNEVLSKPSAHAYGPFVQYDDEYMNGFLPESIDSFCYDIEWVGFVTPETFSLEYNHVEDEFTITAQDALSALQYYKYEYNEDQPVIISTLDTIINMLSIQHIYEKIYITDTVKPSGINNTILQNLYLQQYNNFDENDKALDGLTVLENIMQYLNLTAIAVGKNLFITNYNAVAEGFNNYKVYIADYYGDLLPWYATTYQTTDSEYVPMGYTIVADDFRTSKSTLSTTGTYNNMAVDVDEFPVDKMLPDIKSDENLILKGDESYPNISQGSYRINNDTTGHWYWEHKWWMPKADNYLKHAAFETYYYTCPRDSDGAVARMNDAFNTTPLLENPTHWTWDRELQATPFCCILDDCGVHAGQYVFIGDAYNSKYNPTRYIYMRTPTTHSSTASNHRHGWMPGYDNVTCEWQKMLYVRTKEFVATNKHVLQIKGKWTFYPSTQYNAQIQVPPFTGLPTQEGVQSDLKTRTAVPNYAYVPAKIKFGDYWLKSKPSYPFYYVWSKHETICGLMFKIESEGGSVVTKAWCSPLSLLPTNPRWGDGWYMPLVYNNRQTASGEIVPSYVEVWLGRPYGVDAEVAYGIPGPQCCVISGFDVDVVNVDDLISNTNTESTNKKYETEINPDATNDKEKVTVKISSVNETKPAYSQAIYKDDTSDKCFQMKPVYNAATSHLLIPESHIITDTADQFKDTNLVFSTILARKFKPLASLKWARFNDDGTPKMFILGNNKTDYEYETIECEMIEMKHATPTEYPVVRKDTIRNYMRSNDVIMRTTNTIPRNRTAVVNQTQTFASGTFTRESGNPDVILTTDNANVADFRIECNFENGNLLCSIPDICESTIDVNIGTGTPSGNIGPDNNLVVTAASNVQIREI